MDPTPWLLFIFGTLVGSFLNVVIWRWPRGEQLNGRSRCPHCGHTLSAIDLIPLVSFVLQSGRCRYCKARISFRYPLIELTCGLLFAVLAMQTGPSDLATWFLSIRGLFIAAVLITVFVIDLEHYLILDKLILPATLILLVTNIVMDGMLGHRLQSLDSFTAGGIFSAIIVSGFFLTLWLASSGRWIGWGDVKFGLFLGIALGWPLAIVGLFLAYGLGALTSIPLLLLGKKQMSSKIPFGTFLSAGAVVTLLWGNDVLNWYLILINWHAIA